MIDIGATTLVVGGGGLLGGHLVRSLTEAGAEVRTVAVPWADPVAAVDAVAAALTELLRCEQWNLAWCAGQSVVASQQQQLDEEVGVLRGVLDALAVRLERAPDAAAGGTVFLASSAGAVYAGCEHPPFDESYEPAPVAPYGHTRLLMESAVTDLGERFSLPTLIGRISNLYGPGQNATKNQGLVSALCRARHTGTPLPLYVPASTVRDYLFAEDCGRRIARALGELRTRSAGHPPVTVKIFASGRGTSVQQLIDELTRVTGAPPPVAHVERSEGKFQRPDLRFRSHVWSDLDAVADTDLATGLRKTWEHLAAGQA